MLRPPFLLPPKRLLAPAWVAELSFRTWDALLGAPALTEVDSHPLEKDSVKRTNLRRASSRRTMGDSITTFLMMFTKTSSSQAHSAGGCDSVIR